MMRGMIALCAVVFGVGCGYGQEPCECPSGWRMGSVSTSEEQLMGEQICRKVNPTCDSQQSEPCCAERVEIVSVFEGDRGHPLCDNIPWDASLREEERRTRVRRCATPDLPPCSDTTCYPLMKRETIQQAATCENENRQRTRTVEKLLFLGVYCISQPILPPCPCGRTSELIPSEGLEVVFV